MTARPLDGLRVVELAHIMAGPVCGRMLADLGADVVKLERMPDGDPARGFLPPEVDGEPAAFMMLNRNKRGIAVDLKHPDGLAVAQRLIERADVVIENFRDGVMERLGLGYDALAAANPGLIYCEISGFGRTGPMAHLGGFDLIAQGYSGLMSITGEGPGRPPVKCGAPVTDITAGILAAMAVLAACHQRTRTGKGCRVDTSLFEAGITQTFWHAAIALATGESPGPLGSAHPLSAPYQSFRTADGWLNVGASNEATWQRLVVAIGHPGLADDERYCTNRDRMRHLDELVDTLADVFVREPTSYWVQRLTEAGVPAGPVLTVDEMLHHPQTRARGMVVDVPHARAGNVETIGFPVQFDREAVPVPRGAPLLGQDTRAVLAEIGCPDDEIDRLVRDGVVTTADGQ